MVNRILLCFISLSIANFNCKPSPTQNEASAINKFYDYVAALPTLKALDQSQTYTLKYNYIYDASLPDLTEAEKKDFLDLTIKLTKKYLNFRVKFEFNNKIEINKFFSDSQDKFKHKLFSAPIGDWYIDYFDKNLSAKTYKAISNVYKTKDFSLLKQYFPSLVNDHKKPDLIKANITAINNTFLSKLKAIYSEADLQGQPLISSSTSKRKIHFSYAHWTSLLYQETEVDFFITNSMLAGADTGMPLYVINRGGVTSAFVENNSHRDLGGVGLMTLYPFLSNGKFFTEQRGVYTMKQKIFSMAHLMVHELGHLLARKKENYDLIGSVHRAPIDLKYYKWAKDVSLKHATIKTEVKTLKHY